jgi:ATP-dependent helicase/nuclease subunit B
LKLKPRKPAGFEAPVAGTFMHYILENVTRDIRDEGGFADVSEARCLELTDRYISAYITETLDDFRDKTSRFRYLVGRLRKDVRNVVLDMVRELKNSDFAPVDFELEFSNTGDLPPVDLYDGALSLKINGFVDRVAGDRYGREVVPAGVLYAPARDELLQAPRGATDAELDEMRLKKLRRSGLILDDIAVIAAMAHGEGIKYLPLKVTKDGVLTGDCLAGLEKLGKLSQHISKTLLDIAGNVTRGSVKAEPFYKSEQENACGICDFRTACQFSEKDGDRRRILRKLKPEEAWSLIEGGEA